MELFAVFETWHLGDGNYPPPEKGQLVNLSFEVGLDELARAKSNAHPEFIHLGQAQYKFTGVVLRVYGKANDSIVVLEADQFCFYMNSQLAAKFAIGDVVTGRGTLLYDHYIWVEFLSSYPDPPDLFYKLRVSEIWQFRIPERFITRSERGITFPTRVEPNDYNPNDITSVDTVLDESFVNYVVHFSGRDVPQGPIARTFRS
jgi:hypothetical protein